MIKTKIKKKDVKDSLSFTQKIIDLYGPRLAGSESCRKSARAIEIEMKKHCDSAGTEEFNFKPNAFLGFIKPAVILNAIGTVFLFFSYIVPAAISFSAAMFIIFSQFIYYWEIFDPLYKKKKGCNVYGVIEPKNEVKQQIIISGHHDSAHVFNFFTTFPRLYRIRLMLGYYPPVVILIMTWVWVIIVHAFGSVPVFDDALRYGAAALLIFNLQLFFMIEKEGTPGAGDNLIAVSMAVKMAEIFSKKKNKGRAPLKNTRLIFLSFDAEESGLRGSRAYVNKHKEELQEIPSYNLNIDSIYESDKLKFLISDLNGLRMLSKKMAGQCLNIAHELGYEAKTFRFPFAAGATDAAEMARIGVEATTIIAMPTSVERDHVVYHTADDTVENIQPEAVEAVLKIVYAYVAEKDRGADT